MQSNIVDHKTDVKKQADVNARAAAEHERERQRKNAIRAAAKSLREKTKDAATANAATRRTIAEYKEVCGADLLELEAEYAATVAEGKELSSKLAALRKLTSVV